MPCKYIKQHIQAPAGTAVIQKLAEMNSLGQDELERCRVEASEAKATIEASSTKRTHSSAKAPAVSEAKLEEEVMLRERAERERDALREQVKRHTNQFLDARPREYTRHLSPYPN
jgi:hypothetical protein